MVKKSGDWCGIVGMGGLAIRVEEGVEVIGRRWTGQPRVGIIVGTGLGKLADQIDREAVIPYEEIPHMPRATALSHRGRLVCGQLAGLRVVAMDGRLHGYEGYAPWQVTFPIHLMHAMGIEVLVVSNASGGLNPRLRLGDIVVIEDHITLMGDKRCHDLGTWPCRAQLLGKQVYDVVLIEHALAVARRRNIAVHRGVYAAMLGPSYETRAEYRFLRRIGADVVGMSTVPEVLAAARRGVRVLALSAVTNVSHPDVPIPTCGEMVVNAARQAEPRLREIVWGVLQKLKNDE